MKKETATALMAGLLLAAIFIVGFNSYQLSQLKSTGVATGAVTTGVATGAQQQAAAGPDVIPKGIPAVYGPELGVSFDAVSPNDPALADATIEKLSRIDRETKLDDAQKARYINILYKMENGIACEYCCGARSVIFENGEAACGCAHSYAMRGLTKYLLTKHGSEYTDAQILEEVGKWKTLFFPGILTQKAAVLESQGIELNYINLASNKYRGAEKGASGGNGGGMVGGC